MRDIKEFFYEENSLNKGYIQDTLSTDENLENKSYYQKLYQNLPPVDLMAAYEDLHPGTLEKLLAAMDKEQNHAHMQHDLYLRMNMRSQMLGRMFGIFSIAIIGWVVLSLAKDGMMLGALIFALISFCTIFAISFTVNKHCKPLQKYEKKHIDIPRESKPTHNDQKPFRHYNKNRRRNIKDKS